MSMTRAQKAEREEAITKLREHIKPGDVVYTILDHVSKSGMSRNIRVLLPYKRNDGSIDFLHPNYLVAQAIGARQAKRGDGIVMGGCGMDMGFHLVSTLSRVLFPDGFGCVGNGCPSNDHSNGDRDRTPHVGCPTLEAGLEAKAKDSEQTSTHNFYRTDGRKCKAPGCHWHRSGDYAVAHRWL